MEFSVRYLNLNARKIGSASFGDCLYSHIFEVWQNIYNNNYYLREIYYAGDDEGFDKVKGITEEVAKGYMQSNGFEKENDITENLKSFIRENWNTCKGYAVEFFADDLIQASEYLYNQI